MKHSKILLVAAISAFVAITTSLLGVTGTILGSVISSVLYNVLSETLDKSVEKRANKQTHINKNTKDYISSDISSDVKSNLTWDLVYIFPLVVITIIQGILVLVLMQDWIYFANFGYVYAILQDVSNYNLFTISGISLLILSIYPFIFKPDTIPKSKGTLIAFSGIIVLARGLVDMQNIFGRILYLIFSVKIFDLLLALIVFFVLIYVIMGIMASAFSSNHKQIHKPKTHEYEPRQIHRNNYQNDFESNPREYRNNMNNRIPRNHNHYDSRYDSQSKKSRINKSSNAIRYTSNDVFDDYKRR